MCSRTSDGYTTSVLRTDFFRLSLPPRSSSRPVSHPFTSSSTPIARVQAFPPPDLDSAPPPSSAASLMHCSLWWSLTLSSAIRAVALCSAETKRGGEVARWREVVRKGGRKKGRGVINNPPCFISSFFIPSPFYFSEVSFSECCPFQ